MTITELNDKYYYHDSCIDNIIDDYVIKNALEQLSSNIFKFPEQKRVKNA